MNDIEEDSGHFKMRLDGEIEETPIPGAVDEMRLEKISTRVTVITILIPVLIVIVLVIAYLDIKKRVVQTEDTGTMSVQNLSADLESRFSSLSLRQARLEEQLESLVDRNDKALARIEVNLKKLQETTKALPKELASKKSLESTVAGVEKKLSNVAGSLEEFRGSMEQWRGELVQLRAALAEADLKLNNLTQKMAAVEKEKMDKEAMDLALSLEALKIKQGLKSSIDELTGKVNRLKEEMSALKKLAQTPPRTATSPAPASQPQAPVEDRNGVDDSPAGIEEEVITNP